MKETKRTEGKIKGCISLKDQYKYYKDNYENTVDYKTYVKYIKECNIRIPESVVYESNDFELPYRAGKLHIVKYDRTYKVQSMWAVDFNRTKKEGFKVYFHQPYVYKWRWSKTHTIIKNKSKYKFTACRMAKRMVPKALRSGRDYFKI